MAIDPAEMMRALRLFPDHDRRSKKPGVSGCVDWSISLHMCFGFAPNREEASTKINEARTLWDGVKGSLESNSIHSSPNIDLDWLSLELKPHVLDGHFNYQSHVYWSVDLEKLAWGCSEDASQAHDDQLRWVESNWKPLIDTGVYDFIAKVQREL